MLIKPRIVTFKTLLICNQKIIFNGKTPPEKVAHKKTIQPRIFSRLQMQEPAS